MFSKGKRSSEEKGRASSLTVVEFIRCRGTRGFCPFKTNAQGFHRLVALSCRAYHARVRCQLSFLLRHPRLKPTRKRRTRQAYTQFGGLRPFGVSFLFTGWDEHHGFQLYHSDPSGNYGGWKATAIGANNQARCRDVFCRCEEPVQTRI